MGNNSSLPKLEDPVVLEPSGTHTATVSNMSSFKENSNTTEMEINYCRNCAN